MAEKVTDFSLAKRKKAAKGQLKRNADIRQPEQRLVWAIIRQAIDDCEPELPGSQDIRYFRSDLFARHCEFVGLDTEFARDVLTLTRLLPPKNAKPRQSQEAA